MSAKIEMNIYVKSSLNAEVSFLYIEFQISNGYKAKDEEQTNYGRRYRRLKIVTSKANVIEVERYSDNGGRSQWYAGEV